MKKIILLIFILFSVSGCWNYKELDDYSIVTGMSIDKSGDEYEVSVLISNAKKSGDSSDSSSSQSVVYSGKGNSIFKALKEIGLISPKELYLDHFSILIISEEIASEGIYGIVDFFLRYPNARKDFSIALARDCKAKDTLKIITPLTDFPSQSLADNLNFTSQLQGAIINLNYNELVYDLIANGKEVTMTGISLVGNVEKGSSKENTESSEPETYLKLSNLALFKDDKFINWASEIESLGINIINNSTQEMYIKIEMDDGYVIANTVDVKTNLDIKIKNNKPVISIKTEGSAKVMEVNGKIDLHNYDNIKEIQKKVNNEVEKFMKKGLNFAIKNETDVFGFGLSLYKNYPNHYEKLKDNWNKELDNLKIELKSNLTIKSISSTQNSVEVLDDKQ